MFTRNRVHTSRERNHHRNKAAVLSVLAVYFFKGTSPRTMTAGNGVSTYLALIFGTLLSSQGTDASFVLTLSGFPPGFPSVLRFRLYQTVSGSDFLGAFQVPAFAFPFPAVPTLSEVPGRFDRPFISD